uniref:DNA topoisomerase (ATP-hydrolyzing) n=1 Tax=Globodera pallida TaxID=36090 RepID=A0A183C1A5_GLOPA
MLYEVITIEIVPNSLKAHVMITEAGGCAEVVRHQDAFAIVRMPNKHEYALRKECMAVVGKLSCDDWAKKQWGSPQMHRRFGYRMASGPSIRAKQGYQGRKIRRLPPVRTFDQPTPPPLPLQKFTLTKRQLSHNYGNAAVPKLVAEFNNLTVDSAKYADALQRAIEARGDEQQQQQLLNVFIQVNTSGEPNKRGVRPDQLLPLAKHITAQCHNLSLIGLMSIGAIAQSLGGGEENADFALLRRLRDELQVQLRLPNMLELSMGMSADYHLAIKYGSTNVRRRQTLKRNERQPADCPAIMAQQSRTASLVTAIEHIHRQDGGRASAAFVRAPPNVVSQRMRVLAQVYELLVRNRRATKRDLYYEHKKLYGTQINFNRALTALCKQLSASRSELHVISCSRGFAIGNLRLFDGMDDDSVVDFRASPVAIVESLCHFSLVHSEAQFLLVVEKDAIFQRLIDEQFLHKFPRGILLTGRGYPDFCTRQFLHWLSVQLPALPMLALVDADPYGVEIFLTYKYGSSRSIVEAGAFHLPRLRWLGFLPSEAQKLPIPSNQCLQLSEKDRKRIERIAQRTNGHGEEERSLFNYELSVMLNSSQKLELEALCSISRFRGPTLRRQQ